MDYADNLHLLIEERAHQSPADIAMVFDGSTLSYSELNQQANQLAHYLKPLIQRHDALIAVAMQRSPQLLITMLAILKSGCGYLPLDARHPHGRLFYILDDARPLLVLTDSPASFAGYKGTVIDMDTIAADVSRQSTHNPELVVHPSQLAYAIYTSGSTGSPKAVLVEHGSVVNYTRWFAQFSQCQPGDRIDSSSSVIFDMAVTTTVTALALGLCVVICSDDLKKNVSDYLRYLRKNRINITKLTPSYFRALLSEAAQSFVDLKQLRTIVLGGEILNSKECASWLELYPSHTLINEYGPTETTVAVTQFQVTRGNVAGLAEIVPIGKPGLGIDYVLMSPEGQPVPVGEYGEMYISGPCLARGYLNQQELTASKFIEMSGRRFYKTSDRCRQLPDGNIEFLNRMDDQIKIRGYRIEPGEIESILRSHHQVQDAAILVQENVAGEKQLLAFCLPRMSASMPDKHDLRSFLQDKLADYMIPSQFLITQSFPLNENGKLDKKRLPKADVEDNIIAPGSQIEHQLIQIWKKAFQQTSIGVNSNFFELGGHSLIAAKIIVEIEKQLNKSIRLQDLYQAETISVLSQIVMQAEESVTRHPTPASRHSDILPLCDFQFMFWISKLFEPKIKNLNIVSRRRLSGSLDVKALTAAFEYIFKKHKILSCQLAKYQPALHVKDDLSFHIEAKDLTHLSEKDTESRLSASINYLIKHRMWRKNRPLIMAKLYHLQGNMTELQICVSHITFDDASEDVLFNELSYAYLHYKNGEKLPDTKEHAQFSDYVTHEQNELNKHLEKDLEFWEKYLADTSLFCMPEHQIIHEMGDKPYSSYFELPVSAIEKAQQFCRTSSISFTDHFCASTASALKLAGGARNRKILFNIVWSVRHHEMYEKMIGCFLRLDPFKVDLTLDKNLAELAKAIQRSRVETEPYQACSGMAKLSCLNQEFRKNKVRNVIFKSLFSAYAMLHRNLHVNPQLLMRYLHIKPLRTPQHFIVNINLLNNFVSPAAGETLFGQPVEEAPTHFYDLSKINNVLDICLLRNSKLDKAYLVVSGNLKEGFREQIGNDLIAFLGLDHSAVS